MKLYLNTAGQWIFDGGAIPAGSCRYTLTRSGVLTISLLNGFALYKGNLTDLQREDGTTYSDEAEFLLECGDFFVNPLNPLKEDVEGLQQDVSAIQGGYLGTLLHTDAAPEPGKSGIYKFISTGVVSWLSGTPTVAVGDEVSVVFTDPTYTYTYIQSTTNAQLALKVAYADSLKYYPTINYGNRVLADGGVISDLEKLTKLYVENLKLLDNTVFMWDCSAGIKTRTSGVNTYANKLYDMSAGNNDAVKATEANQPFVGGGIAPNEKMRLKANAYVAPAKSISHQSIDIGNNNPFTVTYVLKHNNPDGAIINSQLVFGGGGIRLGNATIILNTGTRPPKGSTIIIQFVGDSSGGRFYMNGVSYPVTAYNPANIISLTNILSDISGYQFDGEIYHYSVFNKALSPSEIQSQYAYLRLQYPEIEGIAIGNQFWATSNYEGVVTGNGTVIPEVQGASTAVNPELLSPIDFSLSSWVITGAATKIDSDSFLTAGDGGLRRVLLTVGKEYIFDFSISTTAVVSKVYNNAGSPLNEITSGVPFIAVDSSIYFRNSGAGTTDVTVNLLKEVGWSDLTTPAWCYYNNDPLNGAIFGKEYNKEAREALDMNAPQGYRFATKADYTQLANYLGGTSVAGGKTKKEGLLYWLTPNTGATNESGFSAIGAGIRLDNGSFGNLKSSAYFGTENGAMILSYNNTLFVEAFTWVSNPRRGVSLRLIRNEPVGATERTIETGYITNALGVTNLDIPIPFGYQVESIRFDSETNITGLSAKLLTGGLTELETLFTAKSVTANIQKVVAADADQSIQQTDAVVRINGTKADTTKRFRVWVKLTKVVFS